MTKLSSPLTTAAPRPGPIAHWLRTALCAGVLAIAAAHPATSATEPAALTAAETNTVTIDNFTFGPKVLEVKAGTAVTWINQDDIPHTIIDKNRKVFRSKVLDTDDRFTFTFSQPGTYEYFCGLHPHMTARVVVTP